MILTDAILKIQASANIRPESGQALGSPSPSSAGMISLGGVFGGALAGATVAYAMRMYLNDAASVCSLTLRTGAATASGTAQVETATVLASAGATSSGNLALTLTSAKITGSPLAISVPLRAGVHTTASLIAAAIREKLAATPAVATWFDISGTDAYIVLTSRYALANDATLNLAIAAGLGVAVASSANTTAGVAGNLIDRLGGSAKDAFGKTLPTLTAIKGMVVSCPADSLDAISVDGTSSNYAELLPGGCVVQLLPLDMVLEVLSVSALFARIKGVAIADVIVFGS